MREILPTNLKFFFGKHKQYFGVFMALIVAISSIGISYFTNKQASTDTRSDAATPSSVGIINQGASRFEPPTGKAYYGMGQHISTLGSREYYYPDTKVAICSVHAKNGIRPRFLSGYVGLTRDDYLSNNLASLNKINAEEGSYYIPLLGLVEGPQTNFEYTDKLLNDNAEVINRLKLFGSQLKQYGKPVFIRPFLEMNDGGGHFTNTMNWAASKGYTGTAQYNAAREASLKGYKKIVDNLRAGAGGDLYNVAFMWHVVSQTPDKGNDYYESWYPGNRYVDWVGDSWFYADQIINRFPNLQNFAKSKGLPVFIPESGPTVSEPKGITNPNIVPGFFSPYFNTIESPSNVIKGFVYISTNWAATGEQPTWADTSLEKNQTALNYFAQETAKPIFNAGLDPLKVGTKPFEGNGITGRFEKSGLLNIISKDKIWQLQRSNNTWLKATYMKDDPFWESAPVINGLKPYEGEGVTAAWYTASDNSLRVISKNRFYRYNFTNNQWDFAQALPFLSLPNNPWNQAPAINGLKPWDAEGVTAAWVDNENNLRVVSKNRLWRLNQTSGQWDFAQALPFATLPSNPWHNAPVADGLKPWEGVGITASEFINDGTPKGKLVLVSKDKYWTWDLNTDLWDTTVNVGYGNYRDQSNTNIWKKAPFIELDGYTLPNNNPGSACPIPTTPTPTKTPIPTVTSTPTKTPAPTVTVTAVSTPTKTPTPIKTPTPNPTVTVTIVKTPTPSISPKPSTTTTPINTVVPSLTPTRQPSGTPTKIPTVLPSTPCPLKTEGDANCDNLIDLLDFRDFREQYILFQRGQLDMTKASANFNGDTNLDLLDFKAFRDGYIKHRN
jgi:hypothetical protein